MSPGPIPRRVVDKEFRALFVTWIACAIVIVLGAVSPVRAVNAVTLQLLTYIFGTIALGAQSFGHDYGYQTLGFQLSQPVDRRRMLLTKVSVLLPMLVALATLMWWMLLIEPFRLTSAQVAATLVPPVAALLVAPWITMTSRSQLAGTVLTLALIGSVWVLGEVWGIPQIPVISVLVVVAGILTWRTFMRLEAIDGTGAALELRARRRTGVRHGHPFVQLVKKELHLQQLTFAIVAIYLVAWLVLAVAQQRMIDVRNFPLAHLTLLYTGLICLLIGSLASAEERQFGTLQWQTLLPVPRWQQWSIKVAVTMALTLLLGVGLPLLLMRVSPSPDDKTLIAQLPLLTVALIVAVTVSLYVSSVSASGIGAMVVAVPGACAVFLFVRAIAATITHTVPSLGPAGRHLFRAPLWFYDHFGLIALAVVGSLILVVLRFAAINHSLADRSIRRIGQQLAWVAGLLTFAILAVRLMA